MFSIPVVKIDESRRLVYGRATDETPDAQGEVMDYESSKPHFVRWSQEQADATGGRSLGNLRSMHGQVAAGLIKDIQFDDHARAVDIVARVVDDQEWQKVCEGVLTSFSIGGKYVRRWPDVVGDQMVTRYTAVPSEISLVDRPANPNARVYEIVKRDGSVVRKAFKNSEVKFMFTPHDTDHCGRSTAASIIKALQANPSGDLADAFGKAHSGRADRLQQGVSKALERELAKAGMRVKGPSTVGRNGVEGGTLEAIRQIHSGGARKMSPVHLPPESSNSAPAPTAMRADLQGGYPEYRTPGYNPPPSMSGTDPQSASESSPALPPGDDSYGFANALKTIAEIHRRGPARGYVR